MTNSHRGEFFFSGIYHERYDIVLWHMHVNGVFLTWAGQQKIEMGNEDDAMVKFLYQTVTSKPRCEPNPWPQNKEINKNYTTMN